jgi:hypothetical protein
MEIGRMVLNKNQEVSLLKRKKERKAHHPITYFFVEFPC